MTAMIEHCCRAILLAGLLLATGLAAQEADPPVGSDPRVQTSSDAGQVPDSERIRYFASRLQLRPDGSLEVREQITAWALGQQIRHGIYRELITQQMDWWSGLRQARVEVLGSTLGGQPVAHRLESVSGGQRVYLGDAGRRLSPGQYEYELRYRLSDQLRPHAGGSRLDWEVTGSDWELPIDSVLVEIMLAPELQAALDPPRVSAEDAWGNTVPIRVEQGDDALRIFADQLIPPGHGLALVLDWAQPLPTEARSPWQRLSAGHRYGLIGLAVLLAYLSLAWLKVGKDPSPGHVQPRTTLPEAQTPGMLRLLAQMAHDPRCFVADLLQLAVDGRLRLIEGEKSLMLERTDDAEGLPLPLQRLHQALFSDGEQIGLSPSNRSRLRGAVKAHREALLRASEGVHFRHNRGAWLPGVAIALVTLIVMILQLESVESRAIGAFMLVWLSGWTVGLYVLLSQVLMQWRSAQRWQHRLGALGMAAFSLPFVIGELVGLGVLASVAGLVGALILILSLGLLLVFHHWMKAPTASGRWVLDQADGLRLALTEGHAVAADLELAESLLPTAVALDCAPDYAEQLQRRFGTVLESEGRQWFQPAAIGVGLGIASWGVLANELGGSLQSAVQRATVARSRSGRRSSSFGRSSGGGSRGRGGGGGW